MGNLTRDPELRYTPKGTAVAKLGLAVNRTWRNAEGQQQVISIFAREATAYTLAFTRKDVFDRASFRPLFLGNPCPQANPPPTPVESLPF